MPKRLVGGNCCLFTIIIIANIALMLFGIGLLVVGIYLITLVKRVEYLMIAFMAIGLFITIIGIMAMCLRRSLGGLIIYIIIVLILFLGSTIFTVIFSLNKKTVENWAVIGMTDPILILQTIQKIDSNYPRICYSLYSISGLVLIVWILAVVYRMSTSSEQLNQMYNAQMYIFNSRKSFIEAHEMKIDEARAINADKRDLYTQKYPELAKYTTGK